MRTEEIIFSIHGPMISASGDAEIRKYKMFSGKDGKRWLVADQSDAASNIYVDGGPASQGMAGRTLTFPLVDGGSVDFIGPWKTGAEALLKETGQDYTNTYLVRGIIALNKKPMPWPQGDLYSDILHYDEEPVLGSYDRITDMAQEFANKLQRRVYCADITKGGGHAGWKDPKQPSRDTE